MARPFGEVRKLMREYDLSNERLGQELGCAASTISSKLNGKTPWTSEEMWQIMELFNEPACRLHIIFPRDGQNEAGAKHRKIRRSA